MSVEPILHLYNHQATGTVSDELLKRLESTGQQAVPQVLAVAKNTSSALHLLNEVEVSLLDDATIADIHLKYMDIAGATDVITFDHGEIHISVETAQYQAKEFGNTFERELMLYIIHGLLHLAGYEDASSEGRAQMDHHQQAILNNLW